MSEEQLKQVEEIQQRISAKAEDKKKTDFDIVSDFLNEKEFFRNEINLDYYIGFDRQSEQAINSLYIELCKNQKITKATYDLTVNSNSVKTRNPLREFFESNDKRPEGAIKKLVSCLSVNTGIKEDGQFLPQYTEIFLTKWLVAMVASIEGDNYNILMPVLIGPKNIGKSEFWRRLLPKELMPYFCQSKLDQGKDSEAQMCEFWVILNDELDGMNKNEAKSFRNFISAFCYTYRPPFAKKNIKRKRLASLCGTSNDIQIIADHENNRRIIPIEITAIDHTLYNSIDKTDLLLEAYGLYKSGYNYNLTKEEINLLSGCTEDYSITIPEQELITKYFRVPEENEMVLELSSTEIKDFIEQRTRQRLSAVMIGKAMKKAGFEITVKKIKPNTTKKIYKVVEVVVNPANVLAYQN